jgi:hypothetical protein
LGTAAPVATPQICIPEVTGSNLGWYFVILTEDFGDFPQSIEANVEIVKSDHGRFLPHPFEFIIHQSSYKSTLYFTS